MNMNTESPETAAHGGFRALGRKVNVFQGLETFPAPSEIRSVTCISDEVTAVCPVTGQPDWYQVTITYRPRTKCIESKSLKLYLQSFRNIGRFCEDFSAIILRDLKRELDPVEITVEVVQKPRGGIAIRAVSHHAHE